uniref:Peptidyl-prolyl cis-trans isomerase n=1 Tax=Hucho hucho TaxID=62062 RepID=A0A4W5MYD5_9TELE
PPLPPVKTSLNFLKLCKIKFYNYCLIHNVQRDFLVQTGDSTGTGLGGESVYGKLYVNSMETKSASLMQRKTHESNRKKGMVSMVNNGSDHHGSQFLITTGENLDYLDGVHTVFGEVSEGIGVLDKITDNCDVTLDFLMLCTVHLLFICKVKPSGVQSGRIGAEEVINDTDGKEAEELDELLKEAKTQAILLEMVGDLPDAEVKPPENVCKLNPETTDEDLEIIFSRFLLIKCCEIIRGRKSGDSLCYAFIEFEKMCICLVFT